MSDYLQTSGLDILQAWRMVNKATENVEKISRDVSGIFKTAFNFVLQANLKLEEVNISVPKSFSTIRSSRSATEGIPGQKRNFEDSYHNAVIDAVLSCVRTRFSSHEKLHKQISCFHPNSFSEILASRQNVELSLIANCSTRNWQSGSTGWTYFIWVELRRPEEGTAREYEWRWKWFRQLGVRGGAYRSCWIIFQDIM